MRFAPVSFLVLLSSCGSFGWLEIPRDVPSSWKSRELRHGDAAFVLATGDEAARSAYLDVAALAHAVNDASGLRMEKGLVIAVETRDPPLQPYVDNPYPQIEEWHGRAVGDVELGRGPFEILRAFDANQLDPGLAVKMMAYGIPTDDAILGLPRELKDKVAWILVWPTKKCLDSVLSAVVLAASRKELAMWQRVLTSPLLTGMQGDAVEHARSRLADVAYDVPLLTLGLTMKDTTSLKKFCLHRLGLSQRDLEGKTRPGEETGLRLKAGR